MYTVPDMTDFLIRKTSTLKEFLSLLPLLWQPTTAQLNPQHIFIFSYIEKVSIQSIFFYPVLTDFYGDRNTRAPKRKLESVMAALIGYSDKRSIVGKFDLRGAYRYKCPVF